MFNFFKKKNNQYLDCPFLKHSVHFFYDNIRACCSNVKGPVFYENFSDFNADIENIYNQRKQIVKDINGGKYKNGIPDFCEGCCEINANLKKEPIKEFENKIERIYFQNNMSCNAKCTYCVFRAQEKGYKYKVLPVVKNMINKNLLSENVQIYMSGGEITVYPEFDELFTLLSNYKNAFIEIFSSGIKYSESIKYGLKNNRTRMVISLDSGCKETYLKIKCVDCFEKVVDNIKSYISASEEAKDKIVLKYILVDDVNDNEEEIEKFLNLVISLGIKRVRLDINYEKYQYSLHSIVPDNYLNLYDYFHKIAIENNLIIEKCDQSESIIDFVRKQKSGV